MTVRRGWVAALALAMAGCGAMSVAATGADRTGRGDGVRYTIPAGWHAARSSLTPHLTNPREVLSVGTGALPAGGSCAQFPSAALAAMRPTDALVTVQERLGSFRGFPARAKRFSLGSPDTSEAQACAGGNRSMHTYWFEFRQDGRGFHVLVAIGVSAPAARVREALAVLDSLQVTPRRPVRIDGDDAIPYDDASRGLHLVHPSASARRRQALAILDSLRVRPAPFHERLHAAQLPRTAGWRTRVSRSTTDNPGCGHQRVSWASTVPFLDRTSSLPPQKMIEALPPDGIIMAVSQYVDTCRRLKGIPALRPPLDLARATRSGFPGPRGDELSLYRILGRFAGRYDLDVWVFYGRRHPTKAQRAAAQRELGGVRWPAWL